MNGKIQMIFNVLKGNFELVHKKEACKTIIELLGDESITHGDINFFPSNKKGTCHSQAIFISLTNSPAQVNFNEDQLVPLNKILPILFKQVLIDCLSFNKHVFLLIDNIDTLEFKKWQKHFELLKKQNVNIEIYYIGGENMKLVNDIVL